MPANRHREIFRRHACPVVDHPDQRLAAAGGCDLDPPRAGIEGVFDKLLDDACRSLDDLAGGDLVDQGIWKLLNGHAPCSRIRFILQRPVPRILCKSGAVCCNPPVCPLFCRLPNSER